MDFENRPWGNFQVIDAQTGYKVKRITVNPGAKLSLQSHKHRSEHWTVAAGQATITVNEEVGDFARGAAVDIPLGAKHRLENQGAVPLIIIEVQFGDYLGEDDIIRYDDIYSRI